MADTFVQYRNYGIGRKYQPIGVSVSGSDQNQNSGFGRTLGWIQATMQQNTIPSGVKQWSTEGLSIRLKPKFFTIQPSASAAEVLF